MEGSSAERLADHFVSYLFEDYKGSRHVRRVASWVGLIVLGIEKVAGRAWGVPRRRQLVFDFHGKTLKARFNHNVGPRGGIEILEVLPGRGSPDGRTVVTITRLKEAKSFYNDAPTIFKEFTKPSA